MKDSLLSPFDRGGFGMMHTYAGLYYPFIHFKDESWLKMCALYWDSMSRIVPDGYEPEDGPTVKGLETFVQRVAPHWVRPDFAEGFATFVVTHAHTLRARYGLQNKDSWDHVPQLQRPPKPGGPSGTDPRLGYVFVEKLSPRLLDVLIDSGIAERDQGGDPRWIGMHPKLARVYMTTLAEQLALERGLHPVTDQTLDHVAVGGYTMERLTQALLDDVRLTHPGSAHEAERLAACIAIEMVLPANIEEIPVTRILEFRAKHLGERGAFQAYLSDFLSKRDWLAKIDDPQDLIVSLQGEYKKELAPKLEDLRAKLRDANLASVPAVLGLQVATPWAAAKAAALLGIVHPVAGAGAAVGLALGLTKVWLDRRKAQRETKTAPTAYLLSVERDLRAPGLVQRVADSVKRFNL